MTKRRGKSQKTSKPKAGRRERRMQSADFDQRLSGVIKTTYSYALRSVGPLRDMEAQLSQEFERTFPEIVDIWSSIWSLQHLQMERRAKEQDSTELRAAMDLLGSKAFCDARASAVLLERGYPMGSLGPLRAAEEACELMQYLLINPSDVQAWLREDSKFDNLSWIRKKVPITSPGGYDLLNWGIHANPGLIPHLLGTRDSPVGTHFEIAPGPTRARMSGALGAIGVFWAITVVALLYEHQPGLMSPIWLDSYFDVCKRLKTLMQRVLVEETRFVELMNMVAKLALTKSAVEGK